MYKNRISALLLAPWNWKLISSIAEPDVKALKDKVHSAWIEKNSTPHAHREILVPLEGRSLHSLNGKSYNCEPGCVFVFDSFEKHDSLYPPYSPRLKHMWFYFLENCILGRIINVEGENLTHFKKDSFALPYSPKGESFLETWKEIAGNKTLSPMLKRNKFIAAFTGFLFYILDTTDIPDWESERLESGKQIMYIIEKHIESTAGKGLYVDRLASMAGYSKYHFQRIFKNYTGMTVLECINKSRIKRTNEMLEKGSLKKDISEALGFSSTISFSRWFSKNQAEK